MPLIRLSKHSADDPAFLFRVEHIIDGFVKLLRPRRIHVVEIDQWFGARWCGFAGTRGGEDVIERERMRCPPFAPGRVRSERTLRRRADDVKEFVVEPLHARALGKGEPARFLDEIAKRGVFVWYSGDTLAQDRAALMVYGIDAREQRGWYVGFRRDGTAWVLAETRGIDGPEVEALETGWAGGLAPLPSDESWFPGQADWATYRRACDADEGAQPALALCLARQILARTPEQPATRLLAAKVLADFSDFAAARAMLEAIPTPRIGVLRQVILWEWARFHELRKDEAARELVLRELVRELPDETPAWVYLGSCLALQGKLDEALTIHHHATTLRGDPDEAFLNVGLVLRGMNRLEEAAEALEAALELDPDYEVAERALADVRAALTERDHYAAAVAAAAPILELR